MRGLWLRLLRGGGTAARLEIALPVAAGAVITLVLLLLLGLQQGLDHRADRTAWRTPEPAAGEATVLQAGHLDYIGERPITVIELAALTAGPPDVPHMGDFPDPGEVWVSPALASLTDELPADHLAQRFPGEIAAEIDAALLESPGELFAVVGRAPDDPAMTAERPSHQWNDAASLSPVAIDHWSTTPDLYQTTYRDIALLVAVLTALPLVGLGGLAARLTAARRQRRTATLRLLGASTAQVARLAAVELTVLAGAGALLGAALHQVLLPLAAQATIKGGTWFQADLRLDPWLTLAVAAAVVAVLIVGALSGLLPAVRDPLGTYRRSRLGRTRPRWWSLVFIAAAVVLFWLRSSNPFVTIAFTVVVVLGWGLLAVGPWLIYGLGRLLARTARSPQGFLAGRRLSDDPHSAWRAVGGLALAGFISGFVAAGLAAGIGNADAYEAGTERIDAVVTAAGIDTAASEAATALDAAGVPATVAATAPPTWLDAADWATLAVTVDDPGADMDRARTVLAASGLAGPELRLSDDLPTMWLLQDGIVIGFLIMPIAALVGLAAMVIGAIARVLAQRDTLLGLHLAGTPQRVLLAAQRREMLLPTALLGGIAVAAGLAGGTTLGSVDLLNPATLGVLTGLLALAAAAVLAADRAVRPALARVSTDLAERE
ncbi:hypothetical protein GCM10009853_029770 [Glycomyces scopariae]